jgi:hypothetical protein
LVGEVVHMSAIVGTHLNLTLGGGAMADFIQRQPNP